MQYMEGIQKTKQSGSQNNANENNPCSNFQTRYQECTDKVIILVDSSPATESVQERLCVKQGRKGKSCRSAGDENVPPGRQTLSDVTKSSTSPEDKGVVQRNISPGVNNFYLPELNHDVLAQLDYNMAPTSSHLWRPW